MHLRSFSQLTFRPNLPPMHRHHLPSECQSQTDSLYIARSFRMNTAIRIKDMEKGLGRNPNAMILNTDMDEILFQTTGDQNSSSFR